MRSLRTVYSTGSSSARNSFSGAIDGRPPLAYSSSKRDPNSLSAASTITRTVRSGCSLGARRSADR
jgi:hypothetical protein